MNVYDSRRIFVPFLAALTVMLLATGLAAVASETKLAACPVSLSNADGQHLELERYDLRVAVHGPLALAEMEMVFRNPQERQMEGRFLYLLPPGATVSRFAKEVDGKLMEGEVVETQRARAVYREILHTLRDPALLEQDQGNRFSARVFPIPAKGTVRLLLGYTQLLPLRNDERRMTIPLAGMPKIGAFRFNGYVQYFSGESLGGDAAKLVSPKQDGGMILHLEKNEKDWTPQADLALVFKPEPEAPRMNILRAGKYQMAAYRPELPAKEKEEQRDWVFYFDTSASGADADKRRLEAIDSVLQSVEGASAFKGFAFDLEVSSLFNLDMSKVYDGPSLSSHISLLQRRHALGATDLGMALKHIGETARATGKPARFVLVSDGIATWGKREVAEVVAELGEWPARHVLHALVLGGKQDEKMLGAIVEKTHGRIVTLPFAEDLKAPVAKALEDLTAPMGYDFTFYDEGTRWIYPRTFRDVRPGDEMIVFSEIKDGAQPQPGVIYPKALGPADVPLNATPGQNPRFEPLLQREAVAALLAHLEKEERALSDGNKIAESRKQRIELSTKNRVLCPPLTSLLVLESEADYRRYGIDRNALGEIFAVTAHGIEVTKRTAADLPFKLEPLAKQANRKKDKEGKRAEEAKKASTNVQVEEMAARHGADEDGELQDLEESVDALHVADPLGAAPARERGGQGRPRGEADAHVGGNPFVAAPQPQLAAAERSLSRADEQNREQGQALRAAAGEGEAAEERAAHEAPREGGQAASGADAPARASSAPAPEAARSDPNAAESKPVRPEWTKNPDRKPEDAALSELRAKVEAQPRDRVLRNAYAHALAQAGKWDNLQALCFEWLPFDPENPQVFEYLGRSAAGLNDAETALRALSSIAEIAPNQAALLGRAGWVLLSTKQHAMAEALFRQALTQRQDDANLYRGLAHALWLQSKHEDAAKVLEEALGKTFHERYGDVKRVLREELGYVCLAWTDAWEKEPRQQGAQTSPGAELAKRLGVDLARSDALRVTLCWETDANDVDLHVVDPAGEECFYSHKQTDSGLELYSDQTQGLGPEVIRCEKAAQGLYHVGVKYFSAGPMGVSRGVIVIFRPQDGLVAEPQIVPFTLIPSSTEQDMRHLAGMEF